MLQDQNFSCVTKLRMQVVTLVIQGTYVTQLKVYLSCNNTRKWEFYFTTFLRVYITWVITQLIFNQT